MSFKIGSATALQALKSEWTKFPKNWEGSDPCGTNWVGITCSNDRIVSISLGNAYLEGKLSADITALSELQILDLTSNPNLTGPLPPNIGNFKKLTTLNLMGCGFSGPIPESIGSLEQLTTLSLNSNKLIGTIPASIGRLSKLFWFDIADNQIEGALPVSNGTSSPGLDMLLETKHFHFGNNKLSGDIPEKLFSSNMTLLHVLFDGNQYTGKIPDSLSLVKTLTVLRLDRNKLTGDIPSSLNNLTILQELDVSNNQLQFSLIPSWISSLRSLATLRMEAIQLEGPIPIFLFSPTQLQTVVLKRNQINATLDFAKWNKSKSSIDAPRLMGAKAFTFDELKKCTDNFSKANDVGGWRLWPGVLPSGELIAIKRAQQGSSQGELEFKTEIELLSRVHHKNVVKLLGFCFDKTEQMLIYEYIPNGSLTDSLSGKSGITIDWARRLRLIGSSKGLDYLHENADPPIIHRDIKSYNILLNESLTAKVEDFGLSKLVGDPEKVHVTTQVKGTLGYLDPEYYLTNQLTDKSDVYGFGVVMFELSLMI
ncbi:unnamed protein product [Arabidopsis halleri]